MAIAHLEIEFIWEKSDSTFGPCTACKSLIIGSEYTLFIKTGRNPLNVYVCEVTICQSCMDEIEK